MIPERNKDGDFVFLGYEDFTPNLSPQQIFEMGSFGGTYWRPIESSITGKKYKDVYLQYPKDWWKKVPLENLITPWNQYNKKINFYKVRVGQTLHEWEKNKWITHLHPYGWVHWYCDFFSGKRSSEDRYQIERWKRLAGPNGRFRKALINLINKNKSTYDDFSISPARRQTLQHWGYQITSKDLLK